MSDTDKHADDEEEEKYTKIFIMVMIGLLFVKF